MPRIARAAIGGQVYHVWNRANAGLRLFDSPEDCSLLVDVLQAAQHRFSMRLLAWCVMPDHWHLVLWPRADGELSRFAGWTALTHTQRWHARHRSAGSGYLYQGRFRSFPIQHDDHCLRICRYVEHNPVRKSLVDDAEDWPWSSASSSERIPIVNGPISRPAGWFRPALSDDPAELEAIRTCLRRGRPYGDPEWQRDVAARLGLESTFRPRGRPRVGVRVKVSAPAPAPEPPERFDPTLL